MKVLTEKMINTKEYAGQVDLITGIDDFKSEVEYNGEWHCYRLNKKIIPSVTQLLDEGEYIDVDAEILEYAQLKGTLVHKEIEEWFRSGKEGFTSEFYEFLRLFEENKEKFEEKAIWDHKTYSQATPKKREKCYKQCLKYAKGVEYLTGEKITQFYMIWLPHNKPGRIYDLTKEFGENGS